jgi:hypothetical protein
VRTRPQKAGAKNPRPVKEAYWVVSRTFTIRHKQAYTADCVASPAQRRRGEKLQILDAETGKVLGRVEEQPGALPDIVELRDVNSRKHRYISRPNLLNEEDRILLRVYAARYREGEKSALLTLAHVGLAMAARIAAIDPAWNEPWFIDLADEFGAALDRWSSFEAKNLEAAFGIKRARKTRFDGMVEVDGRMCHRSIAIWRAYLDGLRAGMSEKRACEEAGKKFGPKWQTIRRSVRDFRQQIEEDDLHRLARGGTDLLGPRLPKARFSVGRPRRKKPG